MAAELPPKPSSEGARKRMRTVRQRNTSAEQRLRRALHALGLRYRIHVHLICGSRTTVDVVFRSARVAVFVDGCFWHSCPVHGSRPKANADWWTAKLDENRKRDVTVGRELTSRGWHVERIWEHEDPREAAVRIKNIVAMRIRAQSIKKSHASRTTG
ncbi:MAG: DNA mismatch endonuclease Vsr [Acidobacteria bacterium]|nr:DNA mismatch endonuclease Vsr [Acidobacteriota bacterium]